MRKLTVHLILALAAWGTCHPARAQSGNPTLLWDIGISLSGRSVVATIPVPGSGGSNTVATAFGPLTLTTAGTTATVALSNFHFVTTDPSNNIIAGTGETAADCTGSGSSIAPINQSSFGFNVANTIDVNAPCTVTFANGQKGQIGPVRFTGGFTAIAATSIGSYGVNQGSHTVVHNGRTFPLTAGLSVSLGDRVITGPGDSVQVTLADQTVFTIGPNSNLVIDAFVYDPASGNGSIAASILIGVFRWVTGKVARRTPPNEVLTGPVGSLGIRGTDFTTQVVQSGNSVTMTTTVSSGMVDQTDYTQGTTTTLMAGQSGQVTGPQPTLFASVLPASRSVAVTQPATAFASIINASKTDALGCTVSAPPNPPTDFFFQPTDPATNMPVGAPNVPIEIEGGATQTFVFAITPSAAFSATDIQLVYTCNGSDTVTPLVGINSLLLSASNGPAPDVITVGLTPSKDGVARVAGIGGVGLFAISTANIGATATVTARLRLSAPTMPITATVCETAPTTGACKQTPASTVMRTMNNGENTTWTAFLNGTGLLALDPAKFRAFFEFVDSGGVVRGATSVAVTVQ